MVRYSSHVADMNGCARKSSSSHQRSTNNNHSEYPVSTTNGNPNGSGNWKLTKVFCDADEALINRKLPKELLLKVFSHLDVVSLCRCAQVSLKTFPPI